MSSFNSPVIGFSDAPVTIIVFNDYQCLSCKTWCENSYEDISKKLIETKKAKIIFLDSEPVGNDSILISQATFCADEQGKYSEYQEVLFSSQQKIDGWAKSVQLKNFAIDLNLNVASFERCLDSGKYEKDVITNIDYAKSIGVEKIPIFKIVNFEGKEHVLKEGISSTVFENIVEQFQ